ncbi:DUF2142 domain-containing protein [Microbacterium sp. 4R-513]|uniref:DUF2142 domain-containing protein n=1 Tax=Microbacterium sp. 4R-513 TaxID=2567934 RepID=UPI0013E1F009|nr:DUF2142 domain-containing protein [Microbacterium sp. 4R-513]QIG38317.1 DUF2142 domain-containing protein [Microbacterium sp. 4R-513]
MTGGRRTRALAAAIAVPVLIFVTLAAWAFASPVGSTPDDNFHLASIWCGLGDRPGICEESGNPETRLVPSPIINAPCYAYHPEASADCWHPEQPGLSEASWMNANGLYPPLFYATMSVFVGPDVVASVVTMRLFNAALAVGMLTGLFFALPRRARPALVISALASAVPLGLFIIPSTNPSSWAILASMTIWVALYGAFTTTGRRQIVLGAIAVLGAVIGAGARADAAAFAVFAVAIAAILGARRRRPLLVPLASAALVVIVSIAFFLTSGQSDVVSSGLPNENPPLSLTQQLANIVGIPILWLDAFGGSGLGWLDTAVPAVVTVLGFGAFCGAIFVGIHRVGLRRAIALTLAFAALWLVPFVLFNQSHASVGSIVQSRYLLPLMIILVGVASLAPRILHSWRGTRMLVAGAALSLAMAVALHYNIRRYTVGADSNAVDPGRDAEWWWATAPSPLAIWVIGSLAFAAVFVVLWFVLREVSDQPDIDETVAVPTTDTEASPKRVAAIRTDAEGTSGIDGPRTDAPDAQTSR